MQPTNYVYEEEPGKFEIYPVACNIEQVHFLGSLEECQRVKDVFEKFPQKPKNE